MARRGENIGGRSPLHDPSTVENHHLIGEIGDHPEIMGDHQHSHAQFRLQVLYQLENLCLNGDVERRGRLIGDQQSRPADQRHGDHGALPQAPGQFERIDIKSLFGIREADAAEHRHHQLPRLLGADIAMQAQGLTNLVADGVERRQRRHRFLEDDGNTPTAKGAHLGTGRRQRRDIHDRCIVGGGIRI